MNGAAHIAYRLSRLRHVVTFPGNQSVPMKPLGMRCGTPRKQTVWARIHTHTCTGMPGFLQSLYPSKATEGDRAVAGTRTRLACESGVRTHPGE
jgi:hypothetical protein